MFKIIKNLFSIANSTLDVTNTALNGVDKGLQSFKQSLDESIDDYIEKNNKKIFLRKISIMISDNKITKSKALDVIKDKIGEEYCFELDDYLEKWMILDCKLEVYSLLPLEEPNIPLEEYFNKHNFSNSIVKIKEKYGFIDKREFERIFEKYKDFFIKYIANDERNNYRVFQLKQLPPIELMRLFYKQKKEVEKNLEELKNYQTGYE